MASPQLAPVDSREVVRCEQCLLVQFRTSNDLCRRCHAPLDDDEDEPEVPQPEPASEQSLQPASANPMDRLPEVLRSLREWRGMSQADLARTLGVARSWVSKIELRTCVPAPLSLERMAIGLRVNMSEMLRLAEDPTELEPVGDFHPFAPGVGARVPPLLRKRRKDLNLTITALAEKLHVDPSCISGMESMSRGRLLSLPTMHRFAMALDTKLSIILREAEHLPIVQQPVQ